MEGNFSFYPRSHCHTLQDRQWCCQGHWASSLVTRCTGKWLSFWRGRHREWSRASKKPCNNRPACSRSYLHSIHVLVPACCSELWTHGCCRFYSQYSSSQRRPPPTKKNEASLESIMKTLPNKSQAAHQIAFLYVTTKFAEDEVSDWTLVQTLLVNTLLPAYKECVERWTLFCTLNMIPPSCSDNLLTMQEVDCKTVHIFARGVKLKVWTEAENRERDWTDTLKILSPHTP